MEAAHLVLVDTATGEQHDLESCPGCEARQKQIDGAEKDIRAWRARYADLKRDKDRAARENPLWPRAVHLFRFWKLATGHLRSEFDAAAFEMAEPILRKVDDEMCQRAIIGHAYDPFVTTRKNGTKKRHDGWHLIFGTRAKFEEAACKAPVDWEQRRADLLADLEKESAPPSED